ncbi:MAG: helix-hairpin-helix domain-containing protein [Bacteroidales bacterium]|nr:helix-hairpin-helix domain-containing protein [Bacteroidales bacterium]
MLNKRNILILNTLLISILIYSQDTISPLKTDETDISDKIENIAENTDATLDYTELIEDLKYFRENPLNLNYATEEDLRKLLFLNNIQIFNLLGYRESYGLLVSIYELQGIEGFDQKTIQKILPYVKVSKEKPRYSFSLKRVAKYARNEVFIRYQRILQNQKGYSDIEDSLLHKNPNSRYLGNPDKIYFRYGFNYFNNIRFGITAEKDAGEVFLKSRVNDSVQKIVGTKLKNGFDFYSAHFSLKNIGHLKALTIGDYQLRFGQGLTLWSGLAFGKSSDATNIKKFDDGVRPYTSTDENRYFRGIATTIALNKLDISAFYSSHKVDANIAEIDSISGEIPYITSLQETGLHRTPNEIHFKQAVNLTLYGGNVTYRNKRIKLGITAYKTNLSTRLLKDFQLYNQFDFNGVEIFNAGIDYSYIFNKLNIFGEMSISQNGGMAQLHGFTANPHPSLFVTVLYRNYQKEYHNFFSNAFAEGSHNRNEKGLYTGIRLNLHSKWTLSAYIDNFSFPWLKYRVDAPSKGNEFLVQADYNLSNNIYMYFRVRQKNKQINFSLEEQHIEPLINTRKNYFRYHIEYSISPSVILKNRFEYIVYKEGNIYKGAGYLVYQDIAWNPPNGKLSVIFRYSLFDTDSYDERIYAYENDVLYAFSVPAYYYKGSRGYILLKYQITRKINFWLRFAHTYFSNHNIIGTALDEIDGNTKSEIKVQVRFKF